MTETRFSDVAAKLSLVNADHWTVIGGGPATWEEISAHHADVIGGVKCLTVLVNGEGLSVIPIAENWFLS